MQISLSFNPVEDKHEHVNAVVDAVYGVKTSPKQSSPAAAPVTAQPTAVVEPSQPSPASNPAQVADFPNPSIAPTAAASVTPATSTPAGVDLDKNGIPWDARIHSGGRDEQGNPKKNADGSWAKRKGVTPLDHATITKELQNLMAAQIGHAAPPAGLPAGGVLGNPVNVPHQEAVPLPTDPNAYVIAGAPSGQVVAPMPAPVVDTAPAPSIAPMPMAMGEAPTLAPQVAPMPVPAPQPAAAPTTYNDLAVWLAPNLEEAGGKLKREHVAHFCKLCNIVNAQGEGEFALVANRPDAVAWLHQSFVAQIAATV
jgi:hypothetical protein